VDSLISSAKQTIASFSASEMLTLGRQVMLEAEKPTLPPLRQEALYMGLKNVCPSLPTSAHQIRAQKQWKGQYLD
jgi:hypothetical protein